MRVVRDSAYLEELVLSLERTHARLAEGDDPADSESFSFAVDPETMEATVVHRGRILPIDVSGLISLLMELGVDPAPGDSFELTPRLARWLVVSSLNDLYRRRDVTRRRAAVPERTREMAAAQRRIVLLIAARCAADALMSREFQNRSAA